MHASRQDSEPVTVEVEVTEIDGVTHQADGPAVEPKPKPVPTTRPRGWAEWSGRVRTLDSRWWPLWVVLGIIGVVLALTVGLVIAAIYLTFRIIFGVFRWIGAFLTGSPSGGAITRR